MKEYYTPDDMHNSPPGSYPAGPQAPHTNPGPEPGRNRQVNGQLPHTNPGPNPGRNLQANGQAPRTNPGSNPGRNLQANGQAPRTNPGPNPGRNRQVNGQLPRANPGPNPGRNRQANGQLPYVNPNPSGENSGNMMNPYLQGGIPGATGGYYTERRHVALRGPEFPPASVNSPPGFYRTYRPGPYVPNPAGGSFANSQNAGTAWQNDLRYRYSGSDRNTAPKVKIVLPKKVRRKLLRQTAGVIASVTFAVAFFIGGMMLVARHVGNESFIGRYNKGVYEVETEGSMLRPNIPDGYVPLYNLGNVYYKNGDYEQAAAFYYTALEKDPPEIDEECRIRINLALALLHQVDFEDLDTRQKVNRAITHLKAARGVLTEHGCANEKDSKGHSKDAEKLKKDIDEMLRKLEKEGKSKPDEEVTPPPKKKKQEEKQNSSSSARERNLQNELQKNQKENMKQREQKQRMQQESGGDDPYGGGSSGEDPSGSSVSPYATKNW